MSGKVRQEDSLGHVAPGCLAVVSPGTALVHCASFAERVRQAVEASRLAAQGETIELTVSIGLAGVPADTVTSAGALLDLSDIKDALGGDDGADLELVLRQGRVRIPDGPGVGLPLTQGGEGVGRLQEHQLNVLDCQAGLLQLEQ